MRIAVVCSDLGIRVPGPKGASVHLAAISRALAGAGHDVLLVGVAGHGPPPDIGVEYLLLPHPGRAFGLEREMRKISFCRELPARSRQTLAEFAPTVIYERLSLFGTAGGAIARELGIAHAVEVNALLAREESAWRGLHLGTLATAREHAVLAGADVRLAVSAELAVAIEAVAPGPTTHVVPNGVDAEALAHLPARGDARRAFGVSENAFVVGFSGALRPWHGLANAIEALAMLPPQCLLVVAGDGPVRDELAAHADALGVGDRVIWLGHLDHARMPTFLAMLDVAVAPYPPLAEFSFSPLKVFEYLGAGVPTVASDVGQLRELLAGGRGQLVVPGDAADLAAACLRVRAAPAGWRADAERARTEILADHGWGNRAIQIAGYLEEAVYALAR